MEKVSLQEGENNILLKIEGKVPESSGSNLAFIGLSSTSASRRFITEWNIIGSFDAPNMDFLRKVYPPEKEIALVKNYQGKNDLRVKWERMKSEENGYVDLANMLPVKEQSVAYGLVYVYSSEAFETQMLLGSDDAVRVWLNDELVHSHAIYRGASPDQDKIKVNLKKGWNKVLIKVLQGSGGWGFYLRFVDPEGILMCSTDKI